MVRPNTTMDQAYNFNAGPAALPNEVLVQAEQQWREFDGMSVLEISHRSERYEKLHHETQALFAELLGIPAGYKVLFLQGGASTQFAMVPMNLLTNDNAGYYVIGGSWAKKAFAEAKIIGNAKVAAQTEPFTTLPKWNKDRIGSDAAYVHITSNETIEGIQYTSFPNSGDVPLIADMSSDIMSRPFDVSNFSLIYAGAQKNLGPSGVTIVIMDERLMERVRSDQLPTMFRYETHIKSDSLYNTPPVYAIFIVRLVLQWIRDNGGLTAMEEANRKKSALIYDEIDRSDGFYVGAVDPDCRSQMNITFRIHDEQLESLFIRESMANGFVGLKGHRSVGGIRASAYNAVPHESCAALAQFMAEFRRTHG